MDTQILTNFKLHSIDLGEKSGYRCVIVGRVGLGVTQMSDLRLETRDAFERHIEFLVVCDHIASFITSTMPRGLPSRFSAHPDRPSGHQFGFTREARQSPNPENARSEMRLGSGLVEYQTRLARHAIQLESIFHHQENVHVIWRCFFGEE